MLAEVREVAVSARRALEAHRDLKLPVAVPYLGMGSSYLAALAVRRAGSQMLPEEAASFLDHGARCQHAVLLSQSGRSGEVLACAGRCESYVAVTNAPASPLATGRNCAQVVDLHAGKESASASKTYINTLVALFAGLGFAGLETAVAVIDRAMPSYEAAGQALAEGLKERLREGTCRGVAVIGEGANAATAMQGALVLSECGRRVCAGMATAAYDHGYKETARGSAVVGIVTPAARLTRNLLELAGRHGAQVFAVEEEGLSEELSPLGTVVPLLFAAQRLGKLLGEQEGFAVGGKVTLGISSETPEAG